MSSLTKFLPSQMRKRREYERSLDRVIERIEHTPQFQEFLEFLVDELRECQDDPYIGQLLQEWGEQP